MKYICIYKTILSNYVWEDKNKFGIDPILKWKIVKRCSEYSGWGIDMDWKLLLFCFLKGKYGLDAGHEEIQIISGILEG